MDSRMLRDGSKGYLIISVLPGGSIPAMVYVPTEVSETSHSIEIRLSQEDLIFLKEWSTGLLEEQGPAC